MSEIPPIEANSSAEVPFTHVDALLVLGIGANLQRKGPHHRPVIEEKHMRVNAIAAKEIAVKGHLPINAVIIPTGKGTELVESHKEKLERKKTLLGEAAGRGELRAFLPNKLSYLDFQDLMGQPSDELELAATAKVSQGDLMTDLIQTTITKPNKDQDLVYGPLDILPGTRARTTILNLIEALNLLDERAKGVWKGNMAILTSDTGYLQRAEESAKALGLTNILMLSSEQILLSQGYDKKYLKSLLRMKEADFKEQEKNLRGIKELPEFLIPEVIFINNDDRLVQVVAHLEEYYGKGALKKYGVENYRELTAADIRERIGREGVNRTKVLLSACTEADLEELGIKELDQTSQLKEIRTELSQGDQQAEIIRRVLVSKYGDDLEWQRANGLQNLKTIEWYRLKNWIFGRTLPPNDWGETANPNQWMRENIMYNKITKAWLEKTQPRPPAV